MKQYHQKLFPNEINYNKSRHCTQRQRSNYLAIEFKEDDINFENLITKTENGQRAGDLIFLYLKGKDVIEHNQSSLVFKTKIWEKHNHLHQKGRLQAIMEHFDRSLQDTIETLDKQTQQRKSN